MGEELEKVVDQHITQKEISIKHHKNPKVAWEIDTLKDKSDDCQKVLDKLSKQLAA
jgi:hypothetical protein